MLNKYWYWYWYLRCTTMENGQNVFFGTFLVVLQQKRTITSVWILHLMGRLDLAVLFTPSTSNRNQVRWNLWLTYAGVLRLPRWCRQNSHVTCPKKRWGITACMRGILCTGVLQVPSFTCLGGCSGQRLVL